jgi:GNAT superfamily N-acetyltransferase
METTVTLRPATAEDAGFFYSVYASTRAEELSLTGWSDEQKTQFCRMQFAAQTSHYLQQYPLAQISVIERDGVPAGRLYVNRGVGLICIVDIALRPEHRGRGTGTRLLGELKEEARAAEKPLEIHVEKYNPALRLYQRLGFTAQEDSGVYLRMEWRNSVG